MSGVPEGLAAGGGPVDIHPGAVGERRPPADPRQVAGERRDGVHVAEQRAGVGPAAGVQLLRAVPHLRRGVPHHPRHTRRHPRPQVL